MNQLPLIVERADERIVLRAPEVGIVSGQLARGAALAAGQVAGALTILGRSVQLVVPEDVQGAIVSDAFELSRQPVGYADVLYVLAPLASAGDASAKTSSARAADASLVFRSPQSGRFWHASTPGATPLARAGDTLREGQPLGLIEVMKTFSHVAYKPSGALPSPARVVRVLVKDGADVRSGDPLVELESAQ